MKREGGRVNISNPSVFDEETLKRASAIFRSADKFSEETITAFRNSITRGWLTRQYFTRGKHDLVLPAWVIGLLGPDGEGMQGIAGEYSLTNTDLRSYYALGSPRSEEEPVVDHRGGIIPTPSSYTIIFGTVVNGRPLYSSEIGEVTVDYEDGFPAATVYWNVDNDTLVYDVFADRDDNDNEALGVNVVRGFANHPLLVCLTPLDQDGITSISEITYDNKSKQVLFGDDLPNIQINLEPIRVTALAISSGHAGRHVVDSTGDSEKVKCPASLASWAAQFPVRANPLLTIKLDGEGPLPEFFPDFETIQWDWEDLVDEYFPEISTSNDEVDYFFKASAIVLRLLVDKIDNKITVGPSVQEKQWLPALVHQTRALDRLGFEEEVAGVLDDLTRKIDANGLIDHNLQYDAQGAVVLAMVNHFFRTNDTGFIGDKYSALKRVADWVSRQRKKGDEDENIATEVLGLLPPGYASWFNPLYWKQDYYYSHNFWAAGLLDQMVDLSKDLGKHSDAEKYEPELEKYKQNIDDSITHVTEYLQYLPAGPYARDNAEMIFNLHAFYPLKLYQPAFQSLHNTVIWLWENYCHNGLFLIDQPWNAYGSYFSMLIAQSFRYLGDHSKVLKIIHALIENVTNRSGWAEGISPLTRLGSVGDSPNGYAAAEFVNLILDLFAEDDHKNAPVLLKGMPIDWLKDGIEAKGLKLFYNSTLDLEAKLEDNEITVEWDYDNPTNDIVPILYLPYPAKSIPDNCVQLSTRQLQLNDASGSITVELDIH